MWNIHFTPSVNKSRTPSFLQNNLYLFKQVTTPWSSKSLWWISSKKFNGWMAESLCFFVLEMSCILETECHGLTKRISYYCIGTNMAVVLLSFQSQGIDYKPLIHQFHNYCSASSYRRTQIFGFLDFIQFYKWFYRVIIFPQQNPREWSRGNACEMTNSDIYPYLYIRHFYFHSHEFGSF